MQDALDHCSDTHSPVLAAIRYAHPKGSGARRCAARDSPANDADRAFKYLGSLSGADLRAQMEECSEGWMRLVDEVNGLVERPSQAEVNRLWTEDVLHLAASIGERARTASASCPSTALSSRRTRDKVLDRAIYVQNRLKTRGALTCALRSPSLITRGQGSAGRALRTKLTRPRLCCGGCWIPSIQL